MNHSGALLLNIMWLICLFFIFVLLLLFITWEECSLLLSFYYLENVIQWKGNKTKWTPGQFAQYLAGVLSRHGSGGVVFYFSLLDFNNVSDVSTSINSNMSLILAIRDLHNLRVLRNWMNEDVILSLPAGSLIRAEGFVLPTKCLRLVF